MMSPGGARRALREGEPCGDAFAWWADGSGLTVCLVDGLGHGPKAAEAAQMALAAAEARPDARPDEILRSVDAAIRSSRGAAMSVVRIEARDRRLSFAGIGNVRMALFGAERVARFEGQPGIVGTGLRSVQPASVVWHAGDLLLLWTDGLPAHLELDEASRQLAGGPEAIARHVLGTAATGRDDAAVVCCPLQAPPA